MMNQARVKVLKGEIEAALKPLEELFGVRMLVGRVSFSRLNASFGLEAAETADGILWTKEAEAFVRGAEAFGLNRDDLGREFLLAGTAYVIAGLKPRYRNAIVVRIKANGAPALLPPSIVKARLSGEPVPEAYREAYEALPGSRSGGQVH